METNEASEIIIPNNLESERALLNAIMLHPDALLSCITVLVPDDFFERKNRLVYETLLLLYKEKGTIDIIFIEDHLLKRNVLDEIGADYLDYLVHNIPSVYNYEYYISDIKDYSNRRKLQSLANKLLLDVNTNNTTQKLLDEILQKLFELSEITDKVESISLVDAVSKSVAQIELSHNQKIDNTGIISGINGIDEFFGGFKPGEVFVLAARPSMGKTSLAVNIACNAAKETKNVLMCTKEMSNDMLVQRLLAETTKIDIKRLRSGKLSKDEIEVLKLSKDLYNDFKTLILYDYSMMNVVNIRAEARKMGIRGGIDLIIIDYLQLLEPMNKKKTENSSSNKNLEVSENSKYIKSMARELNVPIILLSQLSRGIEARQNKEPILSDLRDSGSIEQDADIVAFLHRPKYQTDEDEKDLYQETLLLVRKNRNGAIGNIKLRFDKQNTRFVDWSDEDDYLSGGDYYK